LSTFSVCGETMSIGGKPASSLVTLLLLMFIALVSGSLVFLWITNTQENSQAAVRSQAQSIGVRQYYIQIDSQLKNTDINMFNPVVIAVKNKGIEPIPSGSYDFYFNGAYCATTKVEKELEVGERRVLRYNDLSTRQSIITQECISKAASAAFRNHSMPFSIQDPMGKRTSSFTQVT